MFTGIDIGGTNTDIAVIDSQINTYKVPNSDGLENALSKISTFGRLAVSTSQPLNEIITGHTADIRTITIPGPGLVYPGAVKGAVSHRGDIVEPIDPNEIQKIIKGQHARAIAIAGKFSVRNDTLEKQVYDIVSQYYSDEQIAISSPIGALDFPARIHTTKFNARIKGKVVSLIRQIQRVNPDFYFVTSTGGLTSPSRALLNPMVLFHSSPATVANGAYYLSRNENCLVIDIGGTTTELVPLKDGKPVYESVVLDGSKTLIRAVSATSIPYGGDSCIRSELCPFRAGNSRSFGGGEPTLTDALNVMGARIGDAGRSAVLDHADAQRAVHQYLELVSSAVKEYHPHILVGTGYLAHYLLSDIAERAQTTGIVPEHAASANAVGAAVSKVSLEVHIHVDTERKRLTLNGLSYPYKDARDEEHLIAYVKELIRDIARKEGAPEEDIADIQVLSYSSYDVVRGWRVTATITDMILAIAPGISVEAL
ncbi:MAG TPA: hydantoinase/oxoprolinase family protein [Methanospirillum sp.]|uniref:hydantoinase/oxoprolinase family protein n=1 Tax=Methanospirillum sp. TaxID=45200 RepID=UPI002CFD4788|nr:hydantoinase/oxoprolinase family protein [Methanospirillum sp.]HOJ96478.1 hydantoinase/oxoprolinase family protein [Methanospirillum sp.]HOL42068.1 hydantoinase/oxoprolinase family protein [Methanospirillum sp.]HPP77279.1 hydantoinase/oxoprolinase family protein [Methanospirillum sp.]